MSEIVIVAAARTAQGRLQGALSSFSAPQLGAFAIQGVLARGGIDAAAVDAVIMGQVLPAAPARIRRARPRSAPGSAGPPPRTA